MIRADRRFSDAVASKVAALERATDAEIVVVVARSSGSYADRALALASLAALGAFLILHALPWTVHPLLAAADLVGVWALVGWLASGPASVRLAGEARRREAVRRAAAAAFHLESVHATPGRIGLLVYVSAAEALVELVPDVGLEARIGRGELAAAAASLSAIDPDRFLAGLDTVGRALAAAVPATGDGRGELADAPRIH